MVQGKNTITGEIGETTDGNRVIGREKSSDGRTTLELQKKKNGKYKKADEVRYNE